MNEEVGFITALLAAPDDRTTLLVYADWLNERGDPRRAEFLRVIAAEKLDSKRLCALLPVLDPIWVRAVRDRIAPGCEIQIVGGPFAGQEGIVTQLHANGDQILVTVQVMLWGRPVDVETDESTVELVDPLG